MRRLFGVLFALGTGLCIYWRNHRPAPAAVGARRGFRCPACGLAGESLDDFVPGGGAGYVSLNRPTYDRMRRSLERDSYRHDESWR